MSSTPETLEDAARDLLSLPRLTWREDPLHGLTLVAEGTDKQVRADVWEWAQAFGQEPTVVEPEPTHRGSSRLYPGWIKVELRICGFEVTVAGRLVGKDGAL
ncbi:MAG: hypothetical protein HOY79_20830 [Streptomyces sp.]|nr:hypothetical protein [Streptomyces sp.]